MAKEIRGRLQDAFSKKIEEEVFPDDEKDAKPLSAFRKPPNAEYLDDDDKFRMAVYGVANWLRARDKIDWDEIAERAVELRLSGVESTLEIAQVLDVPHDLFIQNVDVEKIKLFLNGQVAKMIYGKALDGDEKMLKLVAETRMGWGKKSTVAYEGELRIRPVLNLSLLTSAEEVLIRKGLPISTEGGDGEYVEVLDADKKS